MLDGRGRVFGGVVGGSCSSSVSACIIMSPWVSVFESRSGPVKLLPLHKYLQGLPSQRRQQAARKAVAMMKSVLKQDATSYAGGLPRNAVVKVDVEQKAVKQKKSNANSLKPFVNPKPFKITVTATCRISAQTRSRSVSLSSWLQGFLELQGPSDRSVHEAVLNANAVCRSAEGRQSSPADADSAEDAAEDADAYAIPHIVFEVKEAVVRGPPAGSWLQAAKSNWIMAAGIDELVTYSRGAPFDWAILANVDTDTNP